MLPSMQLVDAFKLEATKHIAGLSEPLDPSTNSSQSTPLPASRAEQLSTI